MRQAIFDDDYAIAVQEFIERLFVCLHGTMNVWLGEFYEQLSDHVNTDADHGNPHFDV